MRRLASKRYTRTLVSPMASLQRFLPSYRTNELMALAAPLMGSGAAVLRVARCEPCPEPIYSFFNQDEVLAISSFNLEEGKVPAYDATPR